MLRQFFATLGDFFSKIAAVWGHAAELEKQNPRVQRTKHELEFLPAAQEIIETPPSSTLRMGIWIIILLFTGSIVLATCTKTDVVIPTVGKIVPSGSAKVIQPLETARIKAIFVRDGQRVKEGDVLIELDPTDTAASESQVRSALLKTLADIARLEALKDGTDGAFKRFKPPAVIDDSTRQAAMRLLNAQIAEHESQLQSIKAGIRRNEAELRATSSEISRLRQNLPLVRERAQSFEDLAAEGLAPRTQYLQAQQELNDTQQSLNAARHRYTQIKESINSTKEQQITADSEFKRARLQELAEAKERMAQLRQDLIKARGRGRARTLRSPSDGVVQQLAVKTVGGVVTPAQELMYIIPSEATLEAEVMLLNKDRGGVQVGQSGAIKVEAYPFTKFGKIPATVRTISADAIQDKNFGQVFKVRAELERSTIRVNGEDVPLTPGMAVTLDIKTDRRRVISFVLTPIIKGLQGKDYQ